MLLFESNLSHLSHLSQLWWAEVWNPYTLGLVNLNILSVSWGNQSIKVDAAQLLIGQMHFYNQTQMKEFSFLLHN